MPLKQNQAIQDIVINNRPLHIAQQQEILFLKEVEGIQGPLEELGLTTFMERREQGSKGRNPGNEELLDFPPSLVLQTQVSMPLESCS